MSKIKLTGHASGTGVLTVTAPNTSTDRTITLPDTTGTLLDENSSVPAANLTGTVADARISALTASKLTGALPAISGASLTAIPAANLTGSLPAGMGGKILSYAAGQIQMTSNISHSGSCAITATGVTFSITSTVTNSNFIIDASGWTPHINTAPSGGNTGSAQWLYRKVNSGSYSSATTYPVYSRYINGNAAYNWDEDTGHCHVYDSALTHTAGDTITYQFYVQAYNCGDTGYFNHLGGGSSGSDALTLNWTILEVN
jgi:hypothetical protein